jgi:hypothetical protein
VKTEIRYKLTTADMTTRDHQWEIGKWYSVKGKIKLCKNGFHCYQHPYLAVLHQPIHGDYGSGMRLFEAEVSGQHVVDGQVKECWRHMRLLRELSLPEITIGQRAEYGIRCALAVYTDPAFVTWAENWLDGSDRSVAAAWAAAWATRAAARAAADAAWAAARAAAEAAARAAARAAAEAAAEAAARAAAWADNSNLLAIAKRVIDKEESNE